MSRATVRLNVYDMYWLNDYASNIGVGIFHSGIEIHGVEYAYGGHPYHFSGVFENNPQDADELGENFKFRESLLLGESDFTACDVKELIKVLGHDFRGDRYHLISRNCNHFSSVFAKTLTGKDIPNWINRLANISGSIPFLEKCLPQEWLTPVALQTSLETNKVAPVSRTGARLATSAPNTSRGGSMNNHQQQHRIVSYRRSIDSAEEATEALSRLNGRQDSRTTFLSGVAGDLSSSASSTSSDDGSGSPAPSYQRLWAQLKNSVAGSDPWRP